MASHRVVSATANPHKLDEIREILGATVVVLGRPADLAEVEEDASTLEGNAELKVAAVVAASGEPALADDTGLEVDALRGAPGVRSARYGGPEADDEKNYNKLLGELRELGANAPEQRRARFRTVVILGWPDGRRLVGRGVVEGTIATTPRGDRGFGYDPVFIPDEGDGRTFGEMWPEEKHSLSHRGRALRELADQLAALGPVEEA